MLFCYADKKLPGNSFGGKILGVTFDIIDDADPDNVCSGEEKKLLETAID